MQIISKEQSVWSISALNAAAKDLLENKFSQIWVEGEISNFSMPSSGHWYFTLKDESSQIRCAMFRGKNMHIPFKPQDGMHILAKVSVSLYEPRGDYQLIAEFIEERGVGNLQRAFEMLKKKLMAQGLFAPEHKKPLPQLPKKIGIITSPTGAALQDILKVLKHRFPLIPLKIYSAIVQGDSATESIRQALKYAIQQNDCDVLIMARGGGAIEDLWAFNDELLAQDIFHCPIPLITGIGHEIDFTIADFVADVRAPTPSAAAQLVVPDENAYKEFLKNYEIQLTKLIQGKIQNYYNITEKLGLKLKHPKERLQTLMQQLDYNEKALIQAWQSKLRQLQHYWLHSKHRLEKISLLGKIQHLSSKLQALQIKLIHQMELFLQEKTQTHVKLATKLESLSPLKQLKLGYSIAYNKENIPIKSIQQLHLGEEIQTQVADGWIKSSITELIVVEKQEK